MTGKSLDELFGEEESILARRQRERREAAEAYNNTPEGMAEREALIARLRKRQEELNSMPDEPEDDEPEDDDEEEDQ